MRVTAYVVGTLLVVTGLTGLGVTFLAPVPPTPAPTPAPTVAFTDAAPPPTNAPLPTATLVVPVLATPNPTALPATSTPSPASVVQTPTERARPITWLAIPRIQLETTVVPAVLVENGDNVTWDIPKFVAGHAENTAGAGQVGNAVILGHLVSRTLGNVFEHLDGARTGDMLRVRSGPEEFDYMVVDVRNVDRTNVEVLDPTPRPTITLITCAGIWNPVLHDYMERLVVRGELLPAT